MSEPSGNPSESSPRPTSAPEPEPPLKWQLLAFLGVWAFVSIAGLTTWGIGTIVLLLSGEVDGQGIDAFAVDGGIFGMIISSGYGWVERRGTSQTRRNTVASVLLWA